MAVQSALLDEISSMLIDCDLFNHLPPAELRAATCKAAFDSVLLTLSKEALDKMLEEHGRMAARIIRAIAISLSRRLRMAVGRLVDYID